MDKLIYKRGEDSREVQNIEFDVSEDLTCEEYRIICFRMAQALGYHEDTIRKTFGDIDNTIAVGKDQLRLLFD